MVIVKKELHKRKDPNFRNIYKKYNFDSNTRYTTANLIVTISL
jgi:hypothetical protein